MLINILPIVSVLHKEGQIHKETNELLAEIIKHGSYEFRVSDINHFYDADLSLILVQSGGSEGAFLKMEEKLRQPYYLLTYGSNNSLAASIEILSYLKQNNKEAEILHGSPQYIANRLNELIKQPKEVTSILGVIGKPSEWLIASNVDYDYCKKHLGIELKDIDIEELIKEYHLVDISKDKINILKEYSSDDLLEAKKVSLALSNLVKKYKLSGLTLRCFDLLGKIHTTGCLGLSLLNQSGIIGTCEGDIPAMISMYLLNKIVGRPGFMANPSRINIDKKEMVFAHCTLPMDMSVDYELMSHFESGIGVGIRGKMNITDITVFKLSSNLRDYYVSEGSIIANLEEENLCRTQIHIQLDDVSYFLKNPFGNHHIIVYGKHKKAIIDFLKDKA